jgi:hypothetical protein
MTIFVNLFDVIGAALAALFLLILGGLALWVKFDNWRWARKQKNSKQ